MHHIISRYHMRKRFRGLDMSRLGWVALGTLVGIGGSVLAWNSAERFGLADSMAATTIFAAVAGLVAFYIASFCASGLLATVQMAATNRRLAIIVRSAVQVPIEPDALYDSFVGIWFADLGDSYVQSLRPSGIGERWRGREPAEAFPARSVIEDPLMMGFFCRFPPFFIALALIALLMGSADIIDNGLTSVTALSELRATLISSAAAFGAAAFAFLAQPLLLALCQGQLRRFVLQLRSLYAVDDGSFELRQLVEAMSGLRRDLAGAQETELRESTRRSRLPA